MGGQKVDNQTLSGLKKAGFSIAATFVKRIITKVSDVELRELLIDQIQKPLGRLQKILSDDDPLDADQIKAALRAFKEEDVKDASIDTIKKLVKIVIDNEDIESIILDTLDTYEDMQADV